MPRYQGGSEPEDNGSLSDGSNGGGGEFEPYDFDEELGSDDNSILGSDVESDHGIGEDDRGLIDDDDGEEPEFEGDWDAVDDQDGQYDDDDQDGQDGQYNEYEPDDQDDLSQPMRTMSLSSQQSRLYTPASQRAGHSNLCVVCGLRPAYNHNGKSYPTCGLTCAAKYKATGGRGYGHGGHGGNRTRGGGHRPGGGGGHRPGGSGGRRPGGGGGGHRPVGGRGGGHRGGGGPYRPVVLATKCVICNSRPVYRKGPIPYVTCGLTHLEDLCAGKANPAKCNYCHMRPKFKNYPQCGRTCRDLARKACLMCRARPKLGKYPFCGRACRNVALKSTPQIREIFPGHEIYEMVKTRFIKAWQRGSTPAPKIANVYKIIESKAFLAPYDSYKRRHGNERFRYHGTTRACTLGIKGQTKLCHLPQCHICNILRTSFKVSLAKKTGAFGAGTYTSSASNKASSYAIGGQGVMLLTKVVLGRVYNVTAFAQVKSLPQGYDSVVFERNGNTLNETVVYNDNAIRPVFLITLQ